MRKYINGLTYDTETATEVSSHSKGFAGDHNYWEAGLYRTKSGRWFIEGHGGPASRFSQPVRGNQNCWSGGSGIIPLTPDQARTMLEDAGTEHANEMLERYFADQLQDA